jgi:1-acyl-sn-glycerol-3-phosphate acyltransferase
MAVPFKPSRSDLIDTTRRAQAVLKEGYVLAIAGEGRLSDREGEIEPLEEGPAYFALRSRVPVVPMAIIGTRWLRFGKTVRMRAGPAVQLGERKANREGVESLTADVQAAIEALLADVSEDRPPGRFNRWLSELFNDRPWLTDPDWKSRAWRARSPEDEHR